MLKKTSQTVYDKLNSPYAVPAFLNKGYFPSLDGWRAVAILLVVLEHAKVSMLSTSTYHQLTSIFIYGELGVRIFFLLSGFLITSLLLKEFINHKKISIKNFFIKRTLRIFPVLYLYLFVLYILNLSFDLGLSLGHFLSPLLYITNFEVFEKTWITGHTWSLAVEEQFYLIWPFIFYYLTKQLWLFCLIVISAIPFLKLFWYYFPAYQKITLMPFLENADAIFFGSLLAILCFKGFFNRSQRIWSIKYFCLTLSIIILVIYFYLSRGEFGFILLPFGTTIINLILAFLILHSLLNIKSLLYLFLNTSQIIKIGVISYSLYIWQQLFLVPLNSYNDFFHWSFFPLNIILSFIAAYFSYYFYELYFLNLKNKLIYPYSKSSINV